MFVTAVSARGADNYKSGDPVGTNSDLTPASFRVEFDAPLEVQNADIELVSCKISKNNHIIITKDNCSGSLRMGSSVVTEQYSWSIPSGSYTASALAAAIANALNDCVPILAYKKFTGSLSANKIQISWAVPDAPSLTTLVTYAAERIDTGVPYTALAAVNDTVPFETTDAQQAKNRTLFRTPNENIWEYCGSVDLGSRTPDELCRSGFTELSTYECNTPAGPEGNFEAFLPATESVVRSSFDAGYDGFDPTGAPTSKPTYMTFEFEPNYTEDGDEVTGMYKYGGLFNKNTMKNNKPRNYSDVEGFTSQISGVLNLATPKTGGDRRGTPYNRDSSFIFPYSNNKDINGDNKHNRRIYYDRSWSGTISMRSGAGRPSPNEPLPVPKSYSFQIDETDGKAFSLAKMVGYQDDKVKVRPAKATLMRGLPQQDAAGLLQPTTCGIVAPLNPTAEKIVYKVGSVGRLNYRKFGNSFISGNSQGLLVGGGPGGSNIFKTGYYKINAVNANGDPTEVVLTDGGEHIIPYNAATAQSQIDTSLFLNDPNTFQDTTNLTEDDVMDQCVFRLEPNAGEISPVETMQTTKEYRIPSFNLGLQNDMVFNLQETDQPKGYQDGNLELRLGKDLAINVFSIMETPAGTAQPATGQIQVQCEQWIPSSGDDEDYVNHNGNDIKRILFNGESNTWNSKSGTGTPIANWTTFNGVNNVNSGVRIQISNADTYNQVIRIAYTNTFNAADPRASGFLGAAVLVETGSARTGSGVVKMEANFKTRLFPYHPVWSQLPCSISAKNKVFICGYCTHYPYGTGKDGDKISNYERNWSNMSKGQFNAPLNVFPPTSAGMTPLPGERPLIMIKTQKLRPEQIVAGPPAASSGTCVIEDFTPQTAGTLYSSGLHSVMYAEVAVAPATTVDFPLDNDVVTQPFQSSFVVEIANMPLSGLMGRSFGVGKLENRRGVGSKLPIVGVVPAEDFLAQTTDPIVHYYYKTPYPQPVQVRLPTRQFLTYLDLNLRDLVSGHILPDLLHCTEVVLRIYDKNI